MNPPSHRKPPVKGAARRDHDTVERAARAPRDRSGRVCLSPLTCDVPQPVQESATIQCPYCGQSFDLMIDTTVTSQRFTTDCEVCCRPFEVVAECEPGEVLSVDVQVG